MRNLIFFASLMLLACHSNNDFELIETRKVTNNKFHFALDLDNNLVRFNGENSSPFYLQNWNFKEDKPANNLISVNVFKPEFEFISNTYLIDSVVFIDSVNYLNYMLYFQYKS